MKDYHVPCLNNCSLTGRKLTVTVPGSKSITNRALLLAALAKGESRLSGVLFSDDSRYLLQCMEDLGFSLDVSEEKKEVRICGMGGRIPRRSASVFVGSAGTAARFLTAVTAMSEGEYRLDASAQMRRRPMKPLLDTLRSLGARFTFEAEEDCFPFTVRGAGSAASAGGASVNIDESSQFLSAMMIASGAGLGPGHFRIEGSHGLSYVRMTARMMGQFGVRADVSPDEVAVYRQDGLCGREYMVEADVSAACYFFAMAAVLGIQVTVTGTDMDSLQGDVRFLDVLSGMGCQIRKTAEGLSVTGPAGGRLKGISADMREFSDQAITLAAIAPFADSPVVISGIGHIRRQESDRISAIAAELDRMGISCSEWEDGVKILPGQPQPALVRTYDDHRMAMGFSLTGLRAEGIVIDNPLCCRKTFENYFDVFTEAIKKCQGDFSP